MTTALGTYGDSPTPPLVAQGRRRSGRAGREGLKLAQRSLTESVSSRLCWYCAGTGAVVEIGSSLTAHLSGVRRCGSPWSCLLCAPVIRERRAIEIDQGVSMLLERGGAAVFATFTLPHHRGDALEPRLCEVTKAMQSTLKGSGWDRRRQRLGYIGAIRSVEVTDGPNGWHPHNHCLLLFERPITEKERRDLEGWLRMRWARVVAQSGFGRINGHGLDARTVTSSGDLSGYLCKVEKGWGVGLELARSDLKKSSGLAPLDHLRNFATTGDVASGQRWLEYERATFGKRAIRWSPGLRAKLLGADEESSDEELAASEGLDLSMVRAVIPKATWDPSVRSGQASALLEELEEVAALLLFLSINPQPLGGKL